MVFVIILSVTFGLAAFYFLVAALIANGMAMTKRVAPIKYNKADSMNCRDVCFTSYGDEIKIRGWQLSSDNRKGIGTIIVMHGGKQNRSDETIGLLDMCCDLAKQGFDVLTIDRRGCGESDLAQLRARARFDRDFAGAIDYVQQQNPSEKIFLFGTSVGAMAAIAQASRDRRVTGVVADSCFKSVRVTSERVLRNTFMSFVVFAPGAIWMGRVICGLERNDAIDRVKYANCPILFINGELDTVAPPSDARDLIEASRNGLDKEWIVPGAGHSLTYQSNPTAYINKVRTFLNKCNVVSKKAKL
jgi:alpha-beta hydrolase superfamily lysophospholipase